MRELTVLVDLDDTIEMLGAAWCEYLNAKHGTSVAHEELDQWDVAKKFPTLTAEEVYAPLSEDEFWDLVKPMDGAIENLKKIIEDGHTVYVVTASGYKSIRAKMEKVLFRYFPFLSWSDVIVASNKQLIKGDVLIDDGIHNLVDGDYEKILMTAPHNKEFTREKEYGIYRANNWEEAYGLVRKIAEGRHGKEMVELYSTECPKCKVLEKKLDMKGIEYQKNNSVMELIAMGFTQAPILRVGETYMGFSEANAWINQQEE